MALKSSTVTVGTTPTLVASGGSALQDVVTVFVRDSTGTMYFGGGDVSTADGWPYDATDAPVALELGPLDNLYAIVAAGSETIKVLTNRRTDGVT